MIQVANTGLQPDIPVGGIHLHPGGRPTLRVGEESILDDWRRLGHGFLPLLPCLTEHGFPNSTLLFGKKYSTCSGIRLQRSCKVVDQNQRIGINRRFTSLLTLLGEYVYLPFPPLSVPTPRNRRMQAGLRTLNEVVQRLIEERRKPQVAQQDLLSMLL